MDTDGPTCLKHGISKYRATDRSETKGWRWRCRECANEAKRHYAVTKPETKRRWYQAHREHDIQRRHKQHVADPERRVWLNMKRRCLISNDYSYRWYGARGITVCERWSSSYEAFLEDVGRRPNAEYSLDRIDNDGNYEPGNVRWATKSEQRRNQRPPLKKLSV